MFYEEVLHKFWFSSHVDSLLTIRQTLAKVSWYVQSHRKANLLLSARNRYGAYFRMAAYKRQVVAVMRDQCLPSFSMGDDT